MRSIVCFSLVFSLAAIIVAREAVKGFPPRDLMLRDAKHKEPKSGVQLGPGNTLTIQQGVGTPTTINVLSFSKNGKLLAAGKDFGRVVVWDVANQKFLSAVDSGQGIVRAVALSSDGQLVATAGQGDKPNFKLWHLPDSKLIRSYDSFGGYIYSLAFASNDGWLLVSDNAGTTQAFDLPTGKQLFRLEQTQAALLSPDGGILMTASNAEFTVWSTSDWTKQRTLPRSPRNAVPLALNLQTDSFVVTSSGAFQLVRLSTGELLPNMPAQPLPKYNGEGFAAFDSSFPVLLFGHSDDRLWAWNSRTGQTCVSDLMYSESASLSPDGSVLAGAKDNSIVARDPTPDGVWLWDTKRIAAKCGLEPLDVADPGSVGTVIIAGIV